MKVRKLGNEFVLSNNSTVYNLINKLMRLFHMGIWIPEHLLPNPIKSQWLVHQNENTLLYVPRLMLIESILIDRFTEFGNLNIQCNVGYMYEWSGNIYNSREEAQKICNIKNQKERK